jgi:putative peptide zinc metalloprotease protein
MFLPTRDCALPPGSAQSVYPFRQLPATELAPVQTPSEVLQRAEGIELIGEFEGSGFKTPPLLARRGDGQVVQLTKLLYEVAAASDGHRDAEAVADVVSRRCGRMVSAGDVAFLAERKLRPLGVLALADGSTPVLTKRPPVMALRHRLPVLSERAVNASARAFTWLHLPFVQLPLLLALAGFDVWLFGVHGIAGGLRSALYHPVLLLAVMASVVIATAFHEFGHASACRYAGARPGAMGVGVYLVWPVFYCDVTDAYRLNRAGRLRTDLGGIYFNGVFALLAGGVFLYTGQQVALLVAFVQHMLVLQQLIPLMRFDGYYVVTDLTGVPDILSRIKPIFRSLLRGREHEPQVAELKPWVRWVVTIYLGALVPALLFMFVLMVIAAPQLIATTYRAFALQLDLIGRAGWADIAAGTVQTLMLALQLGAMAVSTFRMGQMASRPLLRWSRGSVPRTAAVMLGAVALLAGAALALWPRGDYQPIQPGQRGTVQDGLSALSQVPGWVGLTAGHQHAGTGIGAFGALGGASGTATSAPGTVTANGTSGTGPTTAGAPSRAADARGNGGGTAPAPGTTTTTSHGTPTTPTTNPSTTPAGTTPTSGTGSTTSPSTSPSSGTSGVTSPPPTTGTTTASTPTAPTGTTSTTTSAPTTTTTGTGTTPTSTTTSTTTTGASAPSPTTSTTSTTPTTTGTTATTTP